MVYVICEYVGYLIAWYPSGHACWTMITLTVFGLKNNYLSLQCFCSPNNHNFTFFAYSQLSLLWFYSTRKSGPAPPPPFLHNIYLIHKNGHLNFVFQFPFLSPLLINHGDWLYFLGGSTLSCLTPSFNSEIKEHISNICLDPARVQLFDPL